MSGINKIKRLKENSCSSQSGVALITALLIISLVTVASIAMASRQQLDIRRTSNVLQRDQAYLYTLGGEAIAKEVLLKDDATVDNLKEDWAQTVSLPFEGGLLTGSIEDLEGRFNLNNLVNNGVKSKFDVERFKQLLLVLQSQDDASEDFKNANVSDLAEAAADWIDKDSQASLGGAEDGEYLGQDRPYRAANRPMESPSELLLVKGFTPEIYKKIQPFVAALPERTKINVNTIKPEVLKAMAEDITCPDTSKLHRTDNKQSTAVPVTEGDQPLEPTVYTSISTFMTDFSNCQFVGLQQRNIPPTQVGTGNGANQQHQQTQAPQEVFAIASNFFLVSAYSEVGAEDHRSRVQLFSLLQRKGNKIASIMRAQGVY